MTSLCIKLSQFGHKKDRIELNLSGKEELSALYEKISPDFFQKKPSKLTGDFTVERITDDYFSITGAYRYNSYLACSRCDQAANFEVGDSFYHGASHPSAKNPLNEGVYPIRNRQINLEELLEESLFLTVPNTIICDSCSSPEDSDDDATEELCFYSDANQENQPSASPFASLLKLK